MCNREHSTVLELAADSLLDEIVGVVVDGGSGLVEHEYLGLAEESSRQTDQLSLTHTTQ